MSINVNVVSKARSLSKAYHCNNEDSIKELNNVINKIYDHATNGGYILEVEFDINKEKTVEFIARTLKEEGMYAAMTYENEYTISLYIDWCE